MLNCLGIWPVSWFLARLSMRNWVQFAIEDGMAPIKEFEFRSKSSKYVMFEKSKSISPLKRFSLRSRVVSLEIRDKLFGRAPDRLLLQSISCVRLDMLPMLSFNDPVKRF